jgi:hypothetical protein
MGFPFSFRTEVVRVKTNKRVEGKLKDAAAPERGRWEDKFYIDVIFEGGAAPCSAANAQVAAVVKVDERYQFAGEVEFTKFGPRYVIHQVFTADGKAISVAPPSAKPGE